MKGRPRYLNEQESGQTILSVLIFVVVLIFAALLVGTWFRFSYLLVQVHGISMEPTLQSGDYLYARLGTGAERGEIVIVDVKEYPAFEHSVSSDKTIVKRLIAIEGDTLKCEQGVVSLRRAGERAFEELPERYAQGVTQSFPEITLKEGEIFVMGDNRTNSFDSRSVGPLLRSDIIGTVPQWAVDARGSIRSWETFRAALFGM